MLAMDYSEKIDNAQENTLKNDKHPVVNRKENTEFTGSWIMGCRLSSL